VLSPDASELVFTTVSGEGQDAVTGLRIPAAAGVAGWVVMSGQAVAVSEPQRDPRFAADVAASTGYVPTSILAAPVGTDRQTIGVMEVLDRDAERPGAGGDLELLGLFASQAALAIEATRVFEHFGAALLLAAADAVQNRAGMGAAEGGEPDGGSGGELGLGLADALRNAATGQDLDLGHQLQLAGLVAELGSLGSADQQLAVGILSEVTAYVRRRDRRPR
jgi:GAF domain-containing protein